MRKIYFFFLMLLASATLAQAAEYNLYVQADDPTHVNVYSQVWDMESEQYTKTPGVLEDGKYKVTMDDSQGMQIFIQAKNGYKMTSIMLGEDEKMYGEYYQYSWSAYLYEKPANDTYIVKTEALEFAGYVTLKVDKPEAVEVQTDKNRDIIIDSETTSIGYLSTETSLKIASSSDAPLYKVTADGEDVAVSGSSYWSYYEVPFEGTTNIEVQSVFPEGNAKYILDITGVDDYTVVLKKLYINDESVELSTNFEVALGSKVELELNSDYSYVVDGNENFYGTVISEWATKDHTITIVATAKPTFTVTLNVEDASTIQVFKDWNKTQEIPLTNGANTFSIVQRTSFWVVQAEGALVQSIVNDDDTSGYNWWYNSPTSIYVTADASYTVTSKWLNRDKEMVIYCEGLQELKDASGYYSSWFSGTYQSIELTDGYNIIPFCEEDDKATISYSPYKCETVSAYRNGVAITTDGYGNIVWTPADNDIVKIYFYNEPSSVKVTFGGNAAANEYSVTADIFAEVNTEEESNVFAGTLFTVIPAEGANPLKVTVTTTVDEAEVNTEVTANEDGEFEVVATADSKITVDYDYVAVPEHLYIIGTVDGNGWTPANAIEMTKAEKTFTYTGEVDGGTDGDGYFAFTEVQSEDWNEVNAARWSGAQGQNQEVVLDTKTKLTYGVDAALKIANGYYEFTVEFSDFEVNLTVVAKEKPGEGVTDITAAGNGAAEYFNLQGIRVVNPAAGNIYIVRRGTTVTKELVK